MFGIKHLASIGAVIVMTVLTATGASASSTPGPFGTGIDVAAATCYTHNDHVWAFSLYESDSVLRKDLVVESPAVYMGSGPSFSFSGIKLTLSLDYAAPRATVWTHWKDLTFRGTHSAAMSTSWVFFFGAYSEAVNPGFSGWFQVRERFDYLDSRGATIATSYRLAPAQTKIFSWSPSRYDVYPGNCWFPVNAN